MFRKPRGLEYFKLVATSLPLNQGISPAMIGHLHTYLNGSVTSLFRGSLDERCRTSIDVYGTAPPWLLSFFLGGCESGALFCFLHGTSANGAVGGWGVSPTGKSEWLLRA